MTKAQLIGQEPRVGVRMTTGWMKGQEGNRSPDEHRVDDGRKDDRTRTSNIHRVERLTRQEHTD
jgi:hypothetical protein